jgi:hypothetical protein
MIGAVATKHVWPSYTLFAVSITISSENSPNYRSINAPTSLAQAQRAHSFVQELQHGASSSGGLSTNVDMVARAWGRGEQYPPDDSESEADETGSQVERRTWKPVSLKFLTPICGPFTMEMAQMMVKQWKVDSCEIAVHLKFGFSLASSAMNEPQRVSVRVTWI